MGMREKLIELLWTYDQMRMMRMSIEECTDHLIANGVTFAKDTNVPSWIPVSERLPEKRDFVLVFTIDRIVGEALYDGHGQFYWSNTYEYAEPLFVTHWMPLPEPPKED